MTIPANNNMVETRPYPYAMNQKSTYMKTC